MSNEQLRYIRDRYKVPAYIGAKISFEGKAATIVKDKGNYLGVKFDDDNESRTAILHPTYKIVYIKQKFLVQNGQ